MKNIAINENEENYTYDSDTEKDADLEVTDKNSQLCNKLIEEIMTECGDVILKLFHSHNLTYSNGINLEKLNEIMQNSKDSKTAEILKKITDKFMKKNVRQFINHKQYHKK